MLTTNLSIRLNDSVGTMIYHGSDTDYTKNSIMLYTAEYINYILETYEDDIHRYLATNYPDTDIAYHEVISEFETNIVNHFANNSNEKNKYEILQYVDKEFDSLINKAKDAPEECRNYTNIVLSAIGESRVRECEMFELLDSLSEKQKDMLEDLLINDKANDIKSLLKQIS